MQKLNEKYKQWNSPTKEYTVKTPQGTIRIQATKSQSKLNSIYASFRKPLFVKGFNLAMVTFGGWATLNYFQKKRV